MPLYRLVDADGNDLGEMRLGDVPMRPDDVVYLGPGRWLRVLDVVPMEEELAVYDGLLKVDRGWIPTPLHRPRFSDLPRTHVRRPGALAWLTAQAGRRRDRPSVR